MTAEDQVAALELKLDLAERDATLMAIDAFVAWVDEQVKDAERRAIAVVYNHSSNYEKAQSAGILRFWRSKSGVLARNADPEYRQQLRKELEEMYGRLGEVASRPIGRRSASYLGEF